jgi:GNAT superfamily N-acetyltransferase
MSPTRKTKKTPPCTVTRNLKIVEGDIADWRRLKHFHYRQGELPAYDKIFTIKNGIGVIIYAMPVPHLQMRNFATANCFCGFDKRTSLNLVNNNVRCISRVVIDPRYRGLGLAQKLIRHTMPLMNIAVIEAQAVMGKINPFFQKAGLTPYVAPLSKQTVKMSQALSEVGIDKKNYSDAKRVHHKIKSLKSEKADFIERQTAHFLSGYCKKRFLPFSIERTAFILTRLSARPVYYAWFNPNVSLKY